MNEGPTPPTSESTPAPAAPPPESFAARLKGAREAAGLSRVKAGVLVKTSEQSLKNWEAGKYEPSPQKQGAVMRKLKGFVAGEFSEVPPAMTTVAEARAAQAGVAIEEAPDHDPHDPTANIGAVDPSTEPPATSHPDLLTGSGDTPEPNGVITPEPAKPAPIPADIPVGNVHTTPEGVLLRRLADDDEREGSQTIDGRLWMTVGFVPPHPRAKQPRPLVSTPAGPDPLDPAVLLRRTPAEWSRMTGVIVRDPDGWRHDGKSFDDPITREEWDQRVSHSTVSRAPRTGPAAPPVPDRSPQRPDSAPEATEAPPEAREPAGAQDQGKRGWAWWSA